MVRNSGTNFLHNSIFFVEIFSTIQIETRYEDSDVEPLFNNLFEFFRDHYGEKDHPPQESMSALEGAILVDPP